MSDFSSKIPVEYASEKIEYDSENNIAKAALDPIKIQQLRRKLDWHLIPLIAALYLCSFLDRVNIGTCFSVVDWAERTMKNSANKQTNKQSRR